MQLTEIILNPKNCVFSLVLEYVFVFHYFVSVFGGGGRYFDTTFVN